MFLSTCFRLWRGSVTLHRHLCFVFNTFIIWNIPKHLIMLQSNFKKAPHPDNSFFYFAHLRFYFVQFFFFFYRDFCLTVLTGLSWFDCLQKRFAHLQIKPEKEINSSLPSNKSISKINLSNSLFRGNCSTFMVCRSRLAKCRMCFRKNKVAAVSFLRPLNAGCVMTDTIIWLDVFLFECKQQKQETRLTCS